MKQGVVVPEAEPIVAPRFGGVWDTHDDADLALEAIEQAARDEVLRGLEAMLDGYELMTTFAVFGAGFTAPKGKIRLSFEVESYLLERIMPLVKHTGDQLLVMIWTPEAAFADE